MLLPIIAPMFYIKANKYVLSGFLKSISHYYHYMIIIQAKPGLCYGGSNILKTSEYTRPVRLKVRRICLGRQSNKNEGKR